ncbi:hypothetical protein SLITO_v1c07760 [Spiroplasma litorale]|uniref:Uncharacterized protein n=1 Tax=Spiroplasma litorale TaxID=216942 RepID=A0A0K1W252_9MOLU|nr:hypothetical protein [Spiroplasma litorale]AKX34399.1 hypothetical protein SLITO_v1c07760 [Spiroplasma litorale]
MNNTHNVILKITISALISAFLTVLNLIFFLIPGLELSFLIIGVICLIYRTDISFLITIVTSLLSFLYKMPAFDGVSYLLSNLIVFVLFSTFKKQLLKQRWLIFVLYIFISVLYDSFLFVLWYIATDLQNALAIYLSRVVEIHVMFTVYLFMPILLFKKLEIIIYKISIRYQGIVNDKYIEFLENEALINMNKYSNKKSNYISQLLSLIIAMNVLLCFLAYIPYAISLRYNYKLISIILSVPLLMLFFTPLWTKLKKKTNSKIVLTHNCVGLILAITLAFMGLILKNYNVALSLLIVGVLLFGVFIAGFLPMNIEMIKSYRIRNNQKVNTNKILALTCFLLTPIPFVIGQYAKPVYNLTFFLVLMLVILFIFVLNKNIMDKGNVLEVNKEDFSVAWKNKKFVASIFTQNFFIGIDKFFEFGLVFIFFIWFENKQAGLLLFQEKLFVYLLLGYFLKYAGRGFAYLIKINEKNSKSLNLLSNILFLISFVILLSFTVAFSFNNFENQNLIYKVLLIFTQFIIGFGYVLLKRTQTRLHRKMIDEKNINGAFILDHLIGNVLFSLSIAIMFIIFFMCVTVNITSFIALISILVGISIVMLVGNVFINKNSKLKQS